MSFFKKLKNKLFKSSSKLDEGLDAIVSDGGVEEEVEVISDTPEVDVAAQEAEAAQLAEEARLAQEAEAAEAARLAEEQHAAEAAQLAEEARVAEEARLAEQARLAADAERTRLEAEQAAEAEQARLDAQAAALAARREQEAQDIRRAEQAEADRLADVARHEAEAAQAATQAARRAQEVQDAEAARRAEDARVAEIAARQAREAEEARVAQEQAERAQQEAKAAQEAERLEREAREAKAQEADRLEAETAELVRAEREAAEDAKRAAAETARLEEEAEAAATKAAEDAGAVAVAKANVAAALDAPAAAALLGAQEEPAEPAKKPGLFDRLLGRTEKKTVIRRELDDDMLEALEELLIASDMGVDTALRVTANMAEGRFGKKLSTAEIKSLLATEIATIMEPVAKPMPLYPKRPQVVLVVGVNGSGKTTTIGKLALQFSQAGKKVVIAAGDTFRAAAVEQLQVWGARAGVPVLTAPEGSDPASLAFDAMTKAEADGADLLMIDTAGRLQNRADLMEELAKIVRVIRKKDETAPHNTLLVLDATTGQNALNQVDVFQNISDVSGLVMTKLDGTAKGGVLVALADKFGLPIHAIGIGEQIDDLAPFDPDEFAQALTGATAQ